MVCSYGLMGFFLEVLNVYRVSNESIMGRRSDLENYKRMAAHTDVCNELTSRKFEKAFSEKKKLALEIMKNIKNTKIPLLLSPPNAAYIPMKDGVVVSQYFTPASDLISEIAVLIGTYMRSNNTELTVSLVDAQIGQVVMTKTFNLKEALDNEFNGFPFECNITPKTQYRLDFSAKNAIGSEVVIYRSDEGFSNSYNYSTVNGEKTEFSLCVSVYGSNNTVSRNE